MRSSARASYSLLFFLSGATGLIYQLLWIRMLYQTFGSTIQSVTTVVAAFMGGLGLGAWLLGRFADRQSRPAAVYGWLELGIAAFAVVSPLVLRGAHAIYLTVAGGLGWTGTPSVMLRFGLAALVLLVPTTLMGGTLPVLTRAFMGDDRHALPAALGRLYGINTLGAVLGAALAGFALIEHLGIARSLWLTAAVNAGLGALAIRLARPITPVRPAATVAARPATTLVAVALVLLGVSAFASLLDEIAWTRVLVMIVGGSTYAFTLVLMMFLLGIGVGSALVARRRADAGDTAATAALAQGVTAAGAALLLLLLLALPVYIAAIFQVPFLSATARLGLMGLAIGVVLVVPTVGMGMTFPLLTDIVATADAARGADVGRAYALNTIGSILGAAVTGFVLITVLGSDLTLRLGVLLSAGTALLLATLAAHGVPEDSAEHRRRRTRVAAAGLLAALGIGVAVAAPGWSTRLIDLGPTIYARTPMDRVALTAFLEHRGARQLAFHEGPNATVSVWESESGRSLKVNGKADASDRGDMDTQIMVGLAPAMARPGAASALVIGYGSGVTARVLATVPGMRRVRIVEIEPSVLKVDRFFVHVNDSVLSRPVVQSVIDDARSALQLTRDSFDIIVSEPSNPWVAGVATLYTPEFFRIVRRRLAPTGVFGQWIQLYQLPLPVMAGIVRNMRAVFPHVQVWFGSPADVVILASAVPLVPDTTWRDRLVGPGGPHHVLARDWLGMAAAGDFDGRFLLADSGVAVLISRATLEHGDDHPRLEYVAARRFLDGQDHGTAFDSLVAIALAVGEGATPMQRARVLSGRQGDVRGRSYVDGVRRAQPDAPVWAVRGARMHLALRDTAAADSALRRVAREFPGRFAEVDLLLGQIAASRHDAAGARGHLARALTGGADTTQTLATLALVEAQSSNWSATAALVVQALRSAEPSFRRPFPYAELGDAVAMLATDGPPALADTLSALLVSGREGWSRAHAIRAAGALRAGRCEVARDHFVELAAFGIRDIDARGLLERCRRGER